ncbi:hypothetical protein [Paenibacillus gansuensis]|uniref:Glycosyl hydrolase n=1 Tax=Paenibacillus gansuensis TaxID=306542 RepID=A0ABW5PJY1_9BACL
MKWKRSVGLLVLAVWIGLLTACSSSGGSLLPPNHYGEEAGVQQMRALLYPFVTEDLSGKYGVYTNYIESDQNAPMATGHEVLSESAGLLLRFYALTGQEDRYREEWERTKAVFGREKMFSYRYSPKLDKQYEVNAAVDDLRIIRSLYEAGEKFDDRSYTSLAKLYGGKFSEIVIQNDKLYDFYDDRLLKTNDAITLCYIDLKTLQLFLPKKQEKELIPGLLSIISGGYLSDSFPFYAASYNYSTGTYNKDRINTLESVLTILALTEINAQKPESISFLKKHVKEGTLYGRYTPDGVPDTDIRSTAIYAAAAMIGSQLGDEELYKDSMLRVKEFQIRDENNPLNGGFGDAAGQAYSFDNLMALLAAAY